MITNVRHTPDSPPVSNGTKPSVSDLTQFVVPEPPISSSGRRQVWPERFAAMIEQCPGQWLDATAAWGLRKVSPKSVLLRAEALELNVDARTHEGHLFLRIH